MFGISDKIADIINSLMATIYGWFVKPFEDLRSFKGLIFGKEDDTELAFGIFTLDELQNIYQPGMNIFVALSVTGILIGIIMAGMKISSTGINPSNRTYVFEFLKDLVIVGIIFFNLSTIYTLVFGLNYTIINAFGASYETDLIELKTSVETGDDIIGQIIIGLLLLGLSLWANFYYMMRKLTLIILMIMGPLMVSFYLIPQLKGITVGWFKEFVGTVFVQSIHAALYWIVALMAISTTGIESVILYLIFIPTAEAIRSLLGLGGNMTSGLSRVGALFGMAALSGLYGSVKGALGNQSVMGAIRGAYTGARNMVKGKNTDNQEDIKSTMGGANTGTDSGSTIRANRMLRAGEITSRAGKAIFGMAGSIAGSVTGPAGSMIGSTLGFIGGGAAAGAAGRLGVSGLELAQNRLSKGINAARQTASGKLNALSLADNKVANEIASAETAKWASQNKESFISEMRSKFPDAHESSLESMWNKKVDAKRLENFEKAKQAIGNIRSNDGRFANAQSLSTSTANALTSNWAKLNKQQFMADFDKKNPITPDMSEQDIIERNRQRDLAWQNAVATKKKQFTKTANAIATKMSNGLSLDKAYINKDEFASAIAKNVYNDDKTNFIKSFRTANPQATTEEIDSAFSKQNPTQRSYYQIAKQAGKGVSTGTLYSGNNVNTDYLASQIATLRTNEDKLKFIAESDNSGISKDIALKQWQEKESTVYQAHLKSISNKLPQRIELDHAVMDSNKVIKGATALGTGLISGAVATTGIKEVGAFLRDTKIGKITTAGAYGFHQGFFEASVSTKNKNVIASGFKTAHEQIRIASTHVPQNLEAKHAGFKNAISYATGIVGGVRGYQAGSKVGLTLNPYNKAINQKIAEISDISHMVQRIDDGHGNMIIPNGAIQLVTTGNQSYIQVRDKTGHTQIVSRYGSGDSTLAKGQVIYQDLDIQDGALVHVSDPYQYDSAGSKLLINKQINVDPVKLLANRNTSKNPRVVHEIQAFNQQVDSGQWTADDVIQHTQNIRMIVTRDRSYMVGTDANGQEYRISPYGDGDIRLKPNEVRKVQYQVINKRLVKDQTFDHNDNPVEYYSTLDVENLLPPKVNARLARRRAFEKVRYRKLGGTV